MPFKRRLFVTDEPDMSCITFGLNHGWLEGGYILGLGRKVDG